MDTSRNNNGGSAERPISVRPVLKDLNAIEASGKSLKRNSLSSSSSSPSSSATPKVSQVGAIAVAEAANHTIGSNSTEQSPGPAALPDIISNAQHIKENHNASLSGFLDRFNTLSVSSPAGKVDSRLLTVPNYAGHHNSSHTSSDDETFVECDSFADESALLRDTEDFGSILNATELLEDTRIITPAVSTESLGQLSDSLGSGNAAPAEATFVAGDETAPIAQNGLDCTRSEPNCSAESLGQLSESLVNGQSVDGPAEATFVADVEARTEMLEDTRVITPDISAVSMEQLSNGLAHAPTEATFVADAAAGEESGDCLQQELDSYQAEVPAILNESVNEETAPIESQPDDSPVANETAVLNDSEVNASLEQPIVQPVVVVDAHIVGIPIDRVIVDSEPDDAVSDIERGAVSNTLDQTIDIAITNLPVADSTFHFGPAADQTINVTESVDETCVLSSDRTMVMDETVSVASPKTTRLSLSHDVDEITRNREDDAMVVLNPFARVSMNRPRRSTSNTNLAQDEAAVDAYEDVIVAASPADTTTERVSENPADMDYDNFDVSMNELPPVMGTVGTMFGLPDDRANCDADDDDAMDVEQDEEEIVQEVTHEVPSQVGEPTVETHDYHSDDGFDLPAPVSEPPPFVQPSSASDDAAAMPPPVQQPNIFRELAVNQKFDAADTEDDEQFQANNSVLQSADFDFLLACGQTTPNNNYPAHHTPTTAVNLPPICRDSVLLRFDPLLGRQEQLVAPAAKAATAAEKPMQHISDNDEYGLNATLPLQSDDDKNSNRDREAVVAAPCSAVPPSAEAGETAGVQDNVDDDAAAAEGATFATGAVSRTAQQAHNSSAFVNAGDAKMSVGLIEDIKMEPDTKPSFVSSNNTLEEKTDIVVAVRERNTKSLKVDDVEKKLREAELREEAHIRRIAEKDRDIAKISGVMDSYEQAIAELVAEKAELINKFTQQNAELQQDRDENFKHLTCLESTFSDLHSKYERSKQITIQLKEQEETLLKEKARYVELLKAQELRYDKMKQHAIAQLEIANSNLEQMKKTHKNEVSMLRLNLKREEITKQSTLDQLAQKNKENEELIKICDELISSQGS